MKKYGIIGLCALFTNFSFAEKSTDERFVDMTPTPELSITVMSYNIRRMGNDPVEFQWDNRKELIFEQILSKKPAIIGFQEVVNGKQFEDLKKGLPGYNSFGEPRSKHAAGLLQQAVMRWTTAKDECNPIFYDPEQVELMQYSGTFGINPVENLFTSWLPRECTWGSFSGKKGNGIYVYNTHLDNNSKKIRPKQLKMILDHRKNVMHTSDASAVIMGDLNTEIKDDIKKIITEAEFADARKKALVVKGPQETRTGWNDNELKEIDHILVKNANVAEYEVMQSPQGVYPSDHRPVYAKIVLP